MPSLPAAARLFAIALTIASLAACNGDTGPTGSPPGGTISGLDSTSWIVVSVNGGSPVAGAVPTLSFANGNIQGFFGCNQGGGRYRLDSATGQFAVQDVAITLMGCVQAGVSTSESTLVQALAAANRATLDPAGRLLLDGPGGRIVLVPLEHPAAPA